MGSAQEDAEASCPAVAVGEALLAVEEEDSAAAVVVAGSVSAEEEAEVTEDRREDRREAGTKAVAVGADTRAVLRGVSHLRWMDLPAAVPVVGTVLRPAAAVS